MQISDITNAEALDRFVRGLKPRTKQEVVMREPCNLEEAIHLADRFDSLILGLGTPSRPGGFYIERTQPEPTPFWQEVTVLLGTRTVMCSSFHPQFDGQTERVNQTLDTPATFCLCGTK
jgi:hypothetical protein